ncbi:MAG: SDR family oxidoreductase [Propionibacteriaceae bacterium]|jgi:2-deoxy-D-gluconate 3-dehydrogenase|nr:SDR family oxidoreductase [Propionibacteriaceae bacterium]
MSARGVSPVNPFDFRGASVMVTGASRGIGAACARRFAEAGADIIGLATSTESLAQTRAVVEGLGRRFTGLAAHLGVRCEVYRVLADLCDHVPDALVHAAGINRRSPVGEFPDDDWDEVLAVNLTAPFILTRELGRGMVARGSGKVVFLASMLSFQGGLTIPAYAASKGGIAQVTKSFANEWARLGVNVNAVAPGYVDSDMNTALKNDPTRLRQISERIPSGVWATPSQIADAVMYLCSPAASYVHGTVLCADGGWLGR